MADTVELKMRVPLELSDRLDALADALDRPRSWVMEQALASFLEIEDIRRSLAEAEAGDFATAAEVHAAFAKWQAIGRNGD